MLGSRCISSSHPLHLMPFSLLPAPCTTLSWKVRCNISSHLHVRGSGTDQDPCYRGGVYVEGYAQQEPSRIASVLFAVHARDWKRNEKRNVANRRRTPRHSLKHLGTWKVRDGGCDWCGREHDHETVRTFDPSQAMDAWIASGQEVEKGGSEKSQEQSMQSHAKSKACESLAQHGPRTANRVRTPNNRQVQPFDVFRADQRPAHLRQRSSRENLEDKGILKPEHGASEARVRPSRG